MFKRKIKSYEKLDEKIKKLHMWETMSSTYDNCKYTRTYGGIIRTIDNKNGVNQVFISIPNTIFIK